MFVTFKKNVVRKYYLECLLCFYESKTQSQRKKKVNKAEVVMESQPGEKVRFELMDG